MSQRVLAIIEIGGELRRSVCHELVLVVRRGGVSIGTSGLEHITCQPKSVEGLLEARRSDGCLQLQHPQGKLDPITRSCRKLGLTYRLWQGTAEESGPEVERWWPGLLEPSGFHGHPTDTSIELVEAASVRRAIALFDGGETLRAILALRRACPAIRDVPPLVLVEG